MAKAKLCIFLGALLGFLLLKVHWQYEYPGWSETVNITGSLITFERSQDMILVSRGKDTVVDMYKAMGWSHVHDRYVQICIFRLASQGLLTKYLPYSEALYKQDIKSRQMNFQDYSLKSLPYILSDQMKQLDGYVDGINSYLQSHPRPLEFILFNYVPEPFVAADVLTINKFIAYAGLNDICLIVEKLVLEIARETDQLEIFKMVFEPHLNHVNDELIEIYKTIKDFRSLGDQNTIHVPKLTNSNNWVVSGKLSQSGFPILGTDPHMDISNNPNIFYESQYIGEDGLNVIGISAPGNPGIVMGRSSYVAWGLTFGMLDMSDYFVENIDNMRYERDGQFLPLKERVISIAGKDCYFYDTNDGHTIERSLESINKPIGSGRYLAAKYALTTDADGSMVDLLSSGVLAKNIFEMKDKLAVNLLGTNYVLADTSGNIAYQQGGNVPTRKTSTGLLPLPAWKPENLWQGYLSADDYHSVVNPPEGFLTTANNHIQDPDKPIVSTFSALPNRVNRIKQLLQSKDKFSTEDFKEFQSDTHSLVAEQILPVVAPYLGTSDIEKELLQWDFVSKLESKPAAFFKILYKKLTTNILHQFFSPDRAEKYITYCAYPLTKLVSRVVESNNVTLLPPAVIKQSIMATLDQYKGENYGEIEKITINNMIFGGKLPSWLGLDRKDMPTSHCF
ncbi:penicillin acylase 2 proenzyme-like isoform X1 [Bolinopsis microptera]